ncbi:probable cytochrome P450 12a4, mitochondrial [Hermetia illucens]|uniref:probable cytochrome P450 12a4, mitochondrial n=1 Tax=Hermetia illucens TaxID=343691 RepID=UPI0018CBFE19|nr:probable cytochrome P450 12a4, mitochondrial [Hermetia illucens]
MLRISSTFARNSQCTSLVRLFASQISSLSDAEIQFQNEWNMALPYEKIPGPSRLTLLKDILPGGKFTTLNLPDIFEEYRQQYGEIFKMIGMFGKPDNVLVFDPKDFETIYRTEGVWPVRRGLDTVEHYRRKVRPDIFGGGGLAIEQGKEWAEFRTAVNPVMMQPKIVKLYVPQINKFVDEFIQRMRKIRDSKTYELPENFEEELNRWSLEAISIIALDTRLGIMGNLDKNSKEHEFIAAAKAFFYLLSTLDFKPSLWKIFPTTDFKEMMRVLDVITDFTLHQVNEAKKRIESSERSSTKHENEQSVLEKLIKINPNIATVMAIDMITAGVDTTSSAIVSVLYNLAKNPEKQEVLRNELRKILPEKSSPLTPQNMTNLPYLRACIKEALRIHPVVNGNFREAGKDLILKGYRIPKGTGIILQSSHTQVDEKLYTNAKKFIPERWLRDQESGLSNEAKNVNPFTFLPFGFGPRMCIGRRFAELEIMLFVSKVVRNFCVEWKRPDLKFKATSINIPDGNLQFQIKDLEN